jgi:poly(3-hydroxybutyrate) depolymerase
MRAGLRHSIPKRRLRILWGFVAITLLSGFVETLRADFVERVIKDESGEHRYTVFLPEDYSADKKWPVILYLHGAGERGNDEKRQLTIGLAPAIEKRKATFPFIAIFPQCEDTSARYLAGWLADSPDAQRALKILDEVERDFSIDTSRRILTGWSMGGFGTWSIAAATPSKWQAILPLAGGGADLAEKLVHLPIWAFHGLIQTATILEHLHYESRLTMPLSTILRSFQLWILKARQRSGWAILCWTRWQWRFPTCFPKI